MSLQDNQQRPPEEGLNGSNVPGLAPDTQAPSKSESGSKRTSETPEESSSPSAAATTTTTSTTTTTEQQRVDANSRSNNGSMGDLTNSFDRIAIGNGFKSGRTSSNSTGQTPPPPILPPGAAAGQQSVLQRAMNRSNIESAQQQNGVASAIAAGEGGLTPMFNERFLFDDDELEADDSAFVKKYNLNEDDNGFPVLIRRDSHPGMVSRQLPRLQLVLGSRVEILLLYLSLFLALCFFSCIRLGSSLSDTPSISSIEWRQ